MKVIPPVAITDAMLVSSSVPEIEGPAWAAGTAYAKDARVINAHRVYRSLQANNTGHTPGATGNEAWWEDLGPTNRWAMLGNEPAYVTTTAEQLVLKIKPGMVRALGLPEVSAADARVTMTVAGELVFDSQEISLRDERHVIDAYTYFFSDFRQRTSLLLDALPPYGAGEITITLRNPGGTVVAGPLLVGPMDTYGLDEFGVDISMVDYSVVKFDPDFGRATLSPRGWAVAVDAMLQLENTEVDRTFTGLRARRAKPSLYVIGDGMFDCLFVYGTATFRINIPGAVKSRCSISLKAMTRQ